MKDLVHLRDTQDAIQGLSAWCIKNRKAAYKIARCWLKCIKKVKPEHKLTLFHLVNDIVQHSKRKNYAELLEKFQAVLKESMPHLKETKICEKVVRCLNIWSERQVFEEKFITELVGVVDPSQNKQGNEQDILDSFQPTQLCTQIKIMKALEDDTDYGLKTVKESEINLMDLEDLDGLREKGLKDRQHGNDYINDVEDGRKRLEQYIKAIDREITKRRQVIDMLTHGGKYYDSLRGEAHIVAQAYTNFGKRVTNLNKKLQDRIVELEKSPGAKKKSSHSYSRQQSSLSVQDESSGGGTGTSASPLEEPPSPDYDAPSPEADEMELELPDEESHNNSAGDLTSRLDSMRDSLSQGKRIGESAAATNSKQSDRKRQLSSASSDHHYGSGGGHGSSSAEMPISEYLTKLAKGESTSTSSTTPSAPSNVYSSHHQSSHHRGHHSPTRHESSSSSYVPGIADNTQIYRPLRRRQSGRNWTWMRQDAAGNAGSEADGGANGQQPPPLSAWTTEGDPPPATSWPAPRPDPWRSADSAAAAQPEWQQQQEEPVPEWQIRPEEEEPPDDGDPYFPVGITRNGGGGGTGSYGVASSSAADVSGEVYTESVALARLRQRRGENQDNDSNLIDLTRADDVTTKGASSSSSHVTGNKVMTADGDDMEMCGDGEAEFDSFAHEQLEQFDKPPEQFDKPPPQQFDKPPPGVPPPPPVITASAVAAAAPVNGRQQPQGGEPPQQPPPPAPPQYNNQHRPGISNKPTYGYVPPQKSQQEIEEEEKEHQKTLSLQDRLRSLAGVPKDDSNSRSGGGGGGGGGGPPIPPQQQAFQQHSQPPPLFHHPNQQQPQRPPPFHHQNNIRGPPPPPHQQQQRRRRGGRGGFRGGGPPRGGPPMSPMRGGGPPFRGGGPPRGGPGGPPRGGGPPGGPPRGGRGNWNRGGGPGGGGRGRGGPGGGRGSGLW